MIFNEEAQNAILNILPLNWMVYQSAVITALDLRESNQGITRRLGP